MAEDMFLDFSPNVLICLPKKRLRSRGLGVAPRVLYDSRVVYDARVTRQGCLYEHETSHRTSWSWRTKTGDVA